MPAHESFSGPVRTRGVGRAKMLLAGAATGLVALVALLVLAVVAGSSHDSSDGPHVDPLTADGYAALVNALGSGPGGGRVLSVSLDRHTASIEVRRGSAGVADLYYWDGSFSEPQENSYPGAPFDLSAIPVTDWSSRCAAARRLLGDTAAECAVTIAPPDGSEQKAWIQVEASGPTSGNATLYYDRSGAKTGQHVFK